MQVEAKEVDPPFRPVVRSEHDFSNFDTQFTGQPVVASPVKWHLAPQEQSQFAGFSFNGENGPAGNALVDALHRK
jgi:hypothetical protein